MDEFGKESSGGQARVDRFVVPRQCLPEKCRRMLWRARCDNYQEEIWSSKFLKQKRYINFLDEVFGLPPLAPYKFQMPRGPGAGDWPCVPRKKRCLATADNVLDLPTYRLATFPDLLDWSQDDLLVAALGHSYYKWSWQKQSLVDQGFTSYEIQCCKFDPTGKRLLLGTNLGVEIHDERNKCQFVEFCKCRPYLCTITAVDWSPTGNSFVTGCSRGMICAMNENHFPIKSLALIDGTTLVVRISPNARYVAAVGLTNKMVWVLTWPELERFKYLKTFETVKAINWHPWQTSLLGIATISSGFQSSLIMWEPHVEKVRHREIGRNNPYSIDAMRFNHRTGELLLSIWNLGMDVRQSEGCAELVVMSDFNTVVDHWGEGKIGLNRVRTMVFSPDGTKLATATIDEDLILWNFLPNNYKKNNNHKKFTKFPQFLDICCNGFTIR